MTAMESAHTGRVVERHDGYPARNGEELPTAEPVAEPVGDVELGSLDTADGKQQPALERQVSAFQRNISTSKNRFPVELTFKDLTYKVEFTEKVKNEQTGQMEKAVKSRTILNNVSGTVKPGQLLAILGSSGAGKTTLLNALSRRLEDNGELSGEIYVNNVPRRKQLKRFSKVSSYVMQDDLLFSNLTVRENIRLSAQLRLPREMSEEEKIQRMEDVIGELGLMKCADTAIGGPRKRGVSGGERKRTNIGTELITDPSIIFLDEPTSGLDSFNAQNVMQSLIDLAKSGRTVVTTIHQPRSNIFELFDMLLLLSEGRVMYFGPSKDAVAHFSRLGHPCPAHYNPADYFLDIISLDFRSRDAEKISRDRMLTFADEFQRLSDPIEIGEPVGIGNDAAGEIEHIKGASDKSQTAIPYGASWSRQFRLLAERSTKQLIRDPAATIVRYIISVVFAVFLGCLFFDLSFTQRGLSDRSGLLFITVIQNVFGPIQGTLTVFPLEKAIFFRERAAGYYHVSSYFLSRSIAEIPFQLVPPILYSTILYWMVGFQEDADKFFLYVATILLVSMCAQSLGLVVGAMASSVEVAQALGPLIIVIFLLFGGFYINPDSIPAGLAWIQYISLIKWGYQAVAVNEFKGLTFTCTPEELVQDGSSSVCPVTTGEKYLQNSGLGSDTVAQGIYMLVVLNVVFRLFAYYILRSRNPKYKRL